MDRKRAVIADIGDVIEHAQRVDEGFASLQPALVLEAQQRACTTIKVLFCPLQRRAFLCSGVDHTHNIGVVGEVVGDLGRVLVLALEAQGQRLQPLNELESVLRAEREAIVPLHGHPSLKDEGDRPQRLHRLDPDGTVVAGIGLVEQREPGCVTLPVEAATVEDDATDGGAMTADILGGRVNDDVGAVLDRLADDRRRRVVDDQRNAQLLADLRDFTDREDLQLRVRQGLAEEGTGAVITELTEVFRVCGVGPADFDADLAQRVAEQVDGPAIEVGGGNNVVARLGDGQDRG